MQDGHWAIFYLGDMRKFLHIVCFLFTHYHCMQPVASIDLQDPLSDISHIIPEIFPFSAPKCYFVLSGFLKLYLASEDDALSDELRSNDGYFRLLFIYLIFPFLRPVFILTTEQACSWVSLVFYCTFSRVISTSMFLDPRLSLLAKNLQKFSLEELYAVCSFNARAIFHLWVENSVVLPFASPCPWSFALLRDLNFGISYAMPNNMFLGHVFCNMMSMMTLSLAELDLAKEQSRTRVLSLAMLPRKDFPFSLEQTLRFPAVELCASLEHLFKVPCGKAIVAGFLKHLQNYLKNRSNAMGQRLLHEFGATGGKIMHTFQQVMELFFGSTIEWPTESFFIDEFLMEYWFYHIHFEFADSSPPFSYYHEAFILVRNRYPLLANFLYHQKRHLKWALDRWTGGKPTAVELLRDPKHPSWRFLLILFFNHVSKEDCSSANEKFLLCCEKIKTLNLDDTFSLSRLFEFHSLMGAKEDLSPLTYEFQFSTTCKNSHAKTKETVAFKYSDITRCPLNILSAGIWMLNSWFESLASSGTTLAELGDAAFIIQQRDSFHRIIYIKADSDNMARFLVDWGMLWEKDGKDASSKLNLVISYFCDCFFSMWRKVLNYTKAGVIVQPWSNFRGLGLPELKLKEAVVKEFSQNGCRELTVEEITTLIQALLFKQSYG